MLATQANVSAQGLTNAFVTSSPDPPGCCARLVGMVSRTNILPDVGHISTEKSATTPWAYQKFSSADAKGQQAGQKAPCIKTRCKEAHRDQEVRGWAKGMEKDRKPSKHTTNAHSRHMGAN